MKHNSISYLFLFDCFELYKLMEDSVIFPYMYTMFNDQISVIGICITNIYQFFIWETFKDPLYQLF
jgi:hypothetical protein